MVTKTKQTWQMTKNEWIEDLRTRIQADIASRKEYHISRENLPSMLKNVEKSGAESHRYFVKQALREGKPVPAEVLKDYPDLKSVTPEVTPEVMPTANELAATGKYPELDASITKRNNLIDRYAQAEARAEGRPRKIVERLFQEREDAEGEVARLHREILERDYGLEPRAIPKAEVTTPEPLSELQRIHAKRSPQSQASDEGQKHSKVIQPTDTEEVKKWIKDPSSADVSGIDTPGAKVVEAPVTLEVAKIDRVELSYKSFDEINTIREAIENDPANLMPKGSFHRFKPVARKKLGDIAWAVTNKIQRERIIPKAEATPKPLKPKSERVKKVTKGKTYTMAELREVHADRSPRSIASDNRQLHGRIIDTDSPQVKSWITDPGRADITGIDTPSLNKRSPRLSGKTPRITPKRPKLKR